MHTKNYRISLKGEIRVSNESSSSEENNGENWLEQLKNDIAEENNEEASKPRKKQKLDINHKIDLREKKHVTKDMM